MKKQKIAILMANVLTVTSVLPAFAETTIIAGDSLEGSAADASGAQTVSTIEMPDLVETAFLSSRTAEQYFGGDFDITYTFHNQSNGSLNYDNFVVELRAADASAYLDGRADCYGWMYTDAYGVDTSGFAWNSLLDDVDWDSYPDVMGEGQDCVVNISRIGNNFTFDMTEGDTYHFIGTVTASEFDNEGVYVYLGGENVELRNIVFTVNSAGSGNTASGESSGNTADSGTVSEDDSENLEYNTLFDGTIEITKYTGTKTNITIPESIAGKKVTSIGDEAFLGCQNIRTVTLPDGITKIGDRAFYECSSLTKLSIPEGVTSIGDRAFMNCSDLAEVDIPSTLETIGNFTFMNCTVLYEISLPDTMKSIGSHAFGGNTGLYSIKVPEGVTTIEYGTFQDCPNLTEVILPDTVQVIEDHAFYNCRNLTSINIPTGLTSIGKDVFQWCIQLDTPELPDSVTTTDLVNYDTKVVNIRENAVLDWLGWGAVHTKGCVVDEDGIEITFHSQTYEKASNNWDTPVVFLYTGDEARVEGAGYNEYLVLRSDNYAWGATNENGGTNTIFDPENWTQSGYVMESSNVPYYYDEWQDWLEQNKQGVECTVRARLEGNQAIVELENNGLISTVTLPVDTSKPVYLSISGELCMITDMNEVKSTNTIDDIQVTTSKYCFDFYDEDTMQKAEDVKVTYNGQILDVTNSIVTFAAQEGVDLLQAEYQGNTYAYSLSDFETGDTNTVFVSAGTGIKFSYVRGEYQGKWYDLLHENMNITKGNEDETITIRYRVAGTDANQINSIRLKQKNNELAATTDKDNHEFAISTGNLFKNGSVYLEVGTDKETTQYALAVNVYGQDNSSVTLKGDELKFTVDDDIPILGGMEMSFDMPDLPVYLYRSGNTVRVGINLDKEFLSEDRKVTELKQSLENTFNGKEDDMEILDKYLSSGTGGTHSKRAFEISAVGYGEYTVTGQEETEITVQMVVTGELTLSHDRTILVPVAFITVPVVVSVKADGSIEASANVSYNLDKQALTGDLVIDGKVAVELFAGVGVSDILGAGIYGKAVLEIIYNILSSHGNQGLQEFKLSGEVGLKAYAMSWKTELPLITGTYNIYSKTDSLSTYQTALNKLYNSSEYTLDTNNYNSDMDMTNTEQGILEENVYSAIAPKMVQAGDKTLIVYRKMSDERTDENKVMLMYILYDEASDTWGEPAAVCDDGTMDWGFDLISDGTDIWLVYQNADKVLSGITSLDEITTHLNICIQKFITETETFGDVTTLTSEGYNYLPTAYQKDGNVYFAWVHNEDSAYFAENDTNSIQYCKYTESSVAKQTAAEGLHAVTALEIGIVDKNMEIAYVTDDDNNLSTSENTLVLVNTEGTEIYKESGVINTSGFADISGNTAFYWCNDGTLQKYSSKGAETVTEYTDMALMNGYEIADGFLYFVDETEDENIFSVLDLTDKNAQPVELISTENYIDDFSVSDGNVIYVESAADVTSQDVETVSDLKFRNVGELMANDIAIANISVLGNNISYEEGIPVSFTVENHGIKKVQKVKVSVQDVKGNILKEYEITCDLSSGNSEKQTILVDSDVISAKETYGLYISTDGSEPNMSDNVGTFSVDKAEVVVSTTVYATENGYYEKISVKNNSPVTASGYVSVTAEDGSELERIPVYDLGFEEVQDAIVNFSEEDLNQTITATANCGEEYYLFNNTSKQYLGEAVAEAIIYGDANGDDQLSIMDSALIRRYLAGWGVTIDEVAADVNVDDTISLMDSALIRRYLAGWGVVLGETEA